MRATRSRISLHKNLTALLKNFGSVIFSALFSLSRVTLPAGRNALEFSHCERRAKARRRNRTDSIPNDKMWNCRFSGLSRCPLFVCWQPGTCGHETTKIQDFLPNLLVVLPRERNSRDLLKFKRMPFRGMENRLAINLLSLSL